MRICSRCPAALPEGRADCYCVVCRKSYNAEWENKTKSGAKRKQKWRMQGPENRAIESARRRDEQAKFLARIRLIKFERPCYDCGNFFRPECMDFDHVSGEKLFDLAAGASHSWDSVRLEIDKCDLVCACCHRIRTQQRKCQKQSPSTT